MSTLWKSACKTVLLVGLWLVLPCAGLSRAAGAAPATHSSSATEKKLQYLPRTTKLLKAGLPVRVILYGDSISEVGRSPKWFGGAGAAAKNWGPRLVEWLGQKVPDSRFSVGHFAVGGQNTYEGLGRLDYLAEHRPDLVLVAFGANDCAYHFLAPEETGLALASLVKEIRARYGADVVVVGTGGDNPLKPFFRHLPETLAVQRATAATEEALFVDVRTAMLQATQEGKNWADFHLNESNCHPSDKGHQVWAEAAGNVILSALQTDGK